MTVLATPRRIQRKRAAGWQMPEGAVYVGRPTKWGNPFGMSDRYTRESPLWPYVAMVLPGGADDLVAITALSRELVVAAHGWWFIEQPHLMLTVAEELSGRDLACWCPLDAPCHADMLLEMANDLWPASDSRTATASTSTSSSPTRRRQ